MYSPQERQFLLAIEKHIIEGSEHIAKIRSLIAYGDRQGLDMAEAKSRLEQFLKTQAEREAHREQVLRELGVVGSV